MSDFDKLFQDTVPTGGVSQGTNRKVVNGIVNNEDDFDVLFDSTRNAESPQVESRTMAPTEQQNNDMIARVVANERKNGALPMVSMGMKALNYIGGIRNDGEVTGKEAFANGLTDSLSLGMRDKLMAGTQAFALSEGDPNVDLDQLKADRLHDITLDDQFIKSEKPLAGTLGQITGSMALGLGAGKGSLEIGKKVAPATTRYITSHATTRVLAGSALGAAEAFGYRMNKSGDLKRASVDAGVAMIGGTVVGGLLSGGIAGTMVRSLRGKPASLTEEALGSETMRAIRLDARLRGVAEPTQDEIVRQIDELGPDASLLDAFPSLRTYAKEILQKGDYEEGSKGVVNLLATRNDFAEDMASENGVVRKILQSENTVSKSGFTNMVKARFARLSPRYDRAFENYADVRVKASTLTDNIEKLFPPEAERTASDNLVLKNIIKTINNQGGPARRSGRGTKRIAKTLNIRQVDAVKRALSDAVKDRKLRVAGETGVDSLGKSEMRNILNARSFLVGHINEVAPQLGRLNKVYSDTASASNAYDMGSKLLRGTGDKVTDIEDFLGAGKMSEYEKVAFLEGARQAVADKLVSVKTAKGLETFISDNSVMLNRMKAVVGDDVVDTIIKQLRPVVQKQKMVEELAGTRALRTSGESVAFNSGALADAAITGGALNSSVSTAAGLGAGRRMMQFMLDGSPDFRSTQLMQKALDPLLGAQGGGAQQAAKSLQELAMRPPKSGQNSLVRAAMAASGVNAATTK